MKNIEIRNWNNIKNIVIVIVIGSLFQVDNKKKKNTNVNQVTYKL